MTNLWIAAAHLAQRLSHPSWADLTKVKRLTESSTLHQFQIGLRNVTSFHCLHASSENFWIQAIEKVQRWQDGGIQFIDFEDSRYPASFRNQSFPPWIFSLIGHAAWLGSPTLSIVGSREPSVPSIDWLREELPQFLKAYPVPIVSGGARGVDRIAHEICLLNETSTIVFLPSGLCDLYPKNLLSIRDLVIQNGGAFVSEFAPDTPMQKHHFEKRNRLIAALSPLTLIVDAKRKSGTLLTARLCAEQGRAVAVLPGHPREVQMLGSLDLLFEGAAFVRDFQDLVEIFRSEVNTTYVVQPKLDPLAVGRQHLFTFEKAKSEKN